MVEIVMIKYFLILQDTEEIIPIGEHSGLIAAENYVHAHEDNLTHGYRWVIVREFFFKTPKARW